MAPVTGAAEQTTTTDPTRERLLTAAAEVFAEKGYDRAGVQEIAHRAGFTTGAIYGRFRGKADLLLAAMESQSDDEFEALFAKNRPRSSTTARPCCSRRSSPPGATPRWPSCCAGPSSTWPTR